MCQWLYQRHHHYRVCNVGVLIFAMGGVRLYNSVIQTHTHTHIYVWWNCAVGEAHPTPVQDMPIKRGGWMTRCIQLARLVENNEWESARAVSAAYLKCGVPA